MTAKHAKRRVHLTDCPDELLEYIKRNADGAVGDSFVVSCIKRGFDELDLNDLDLNPVKEPQATYRVALAGPECDDLVACLDYGVKPRLKGALLGLCLVKGAEKFNLEGGIKLKDVVLPYAQQQRKGRQAAPSQSKPAESVEPVAEGQDENSVPTEDVQTSSDQLGNYQAAGDELKQEAEELVPSVDDEGELETYEDDNKPRAITGASPEAAKFISSLDF